MKKWFNRWRLRILLVLLAISGAAYYYLQPLQIFEQAKVELINLKAEDYQLTTLLVDTGSDNTACFQHNSQLPSISTLIDEKASYRLLVWNLHKGEDDGWQDKIREFSQNTDFLLLQEATQQNQLPHFLDPQKNWYGVQAGTFAYRGNMSGVMMVSPFQPQRFCVGSENEPWIRIPKIAEAMVYPLNANRTLLVINLHLVNFEWNPSNYHNQLSTMFRLVSQHQGPIILAGDFNSWNVKRLNLIRDLAQQYGLTEVKFTPDVRMNFIGNPLDHIFVRDIRVQKAWSEQTDSSDHNPLLMDFTLD